MGLGQWGKNLQLLYDVYLGSKSKLWIIWTTQNCLKNISVLNKRVLFVKKGLF